MDPIEIEGPDGAVIEFPAGTDDATIQQAMAAAYPSPPAGEAPAAQGGPRYGEAGTFERTWEGLTPAQVEAYQKFHDENGGIQSNQPAGTDGNPLLVGDDMSPEDMQKLVDDGATFIDREGRMNRKADDLYGLYTGLQRPAINVGNWIEGGIKKVAGEGAAEAFHDIRPYHTTQEAADEMEQLARGANVRAGRGGQLLGQAASAIPATILTRNPWLAGAVEGGLSSTAQDAKGLAMDAGFGAVTNRLGDGAVRMLGGVVSPNVAPGTQRLLDSGVTPSPGQLLGGGFHKAEDATTGVLGLGELTGGSQRQAAASYNRGAFNRPLERLGMKAPEGLNTHQMVDFTQQALDDAYNEVIPRLNVRLDRDFMTDFQDLDNMSQGLSADQKGMWDNLIQREVAPRFNSAQGPANGRITGDSFKELESILGREARDFRASPSPHDRRYAAAVRELQSSIRDMAARQNPEDAATLQGINQSYRELTILEDATNAAREGGGGQFTPDQLGRASRAADSTMRRRASARNEDIYGQYAEDGAALLNRTVNDSGTASRGAMTTALAAGFFGGKVAVAVNPWAVALLGAGALPYTRVGNRVFTAAVTARPRSITDPIRQGLDASAPFAGQLAAMTNTMTRNENRASRAEDEEINAALGYGPESEGAADLEGLY